MNKIIWKDIDSTSIKGLLISELPAITKPKMRVQETQIDGVDGSIIEELGYESYDKQILIGLSRDFDIDEVIAYFSGEGKVVFSNEPDKYYKAKIIEQIDYTRLLRFRTATVTFRVQPFKYEYQEDATILGKNEIDLSNFTYTYCTVEGSENSLVVTPTGTENPVVKINCTLVAGTYYLHLKKVVPSINVAFYDENGNRTLSSNLKSDGCFEITKKTTEMRINTPVSSGSYTLNFEDLYINEGTENLGYEPYGISVDEISADNKGNHKSKPIITIKGNGTIGFILNNEHLFNYTFPDGENVVVVDSEKQDAYVGSVLKNRNMSGEFPILKKGENTISWEGNVTSIRINSQSRWI